MKVYQLRKLLAIVTRHLHHRQEDKQEAAWFPKLAHKIFASSYFYIVLMQVDSNVPNPTVLLSDHKNAYPVKGAVWGKTTAARSGMYKHFGVIE
ncbi:hypothetical protein DYBT9623_05296 [Dyadobacter sp. CECT 9623]|uniref:Uncharacterized protein n=1 Tax=Dyadobacter linearis TaxID=2823330 RepID=A0ABM8UYC5_9BACT|nr:hypothetical protein DYBT9623_05296 [Dyadobacter sp. CECT 9623]